jgi:hypothetical protein
MAEPGGSRAFSCDLRFELRCSRSGNCIAFRANTKTGKNMRGLAILIVALVTMAIIARPHEPHFMLQATGPMPPVNVP